MQIAAAGKAGFPGDLFHRYLFIRELAAYGGKPDVLQYAAEGMPAVQLLEQSLQLTAA
ncbi:hypothetical protein D3C85_1916700 [compost metagenome]